MNRTRSSLRPALAALAALATVAALAPSLAMAQGAEPRRLTLDDALSLAGRNNFDLRVARARLDQAAVNVEQAWAGLLPTLAAQGKFTYNYPNAVIALPFGPGGSTINVTVAKTDQLDGAVNLSLPLLVPSAWYQLGAARAGVDASRAGFEVSRAQVLLAVAQSFYLAASADEVLAARRHAVEVAGKTLTDAKAKVSAGTANRVELTRAQVAYERATQAVAEADATRAQAYRGLATAAGIDGEFRVDPGAMPADRFGSADELGKMALTLRPEFAQAERNLESARASVRSAQWRWAPSLSGFGSARFFNYAGFSGKEYAIAAGLQLDWILYDGGLRDSQRHLAQAQTAEQQARLDQLHRTVNDEIENARRDVEVKRTALDTATHAVQLSKETLDLVRVQHGAGTATQLDLLTAQDQLITSELQLAQARFNLALADLSLQRQVGTFPGNGAR